MKRQFLRRVLRDGGSLVNELSNGKPSMVQVDITHLADSFGISSYRVIKIISNLAQLYGARLMYYDLPIGQHKGLRLFGYKQPIQKLAVRLSELSSMSNKFPKTERKSTNITQLNKSLKYQVQKSRFKNTWWVKLNNAIMETIKMDPKKYNYTNPYNDISHYEVLRYKHKKLQKYNHGK